MKCLDRISHSSACFFFLPLCDASTCLPLAARHADVLLAAQAGLARDPRMAERHHGERCGHHRPGRRSGVEPHGHLLQLRKMAFPWRQPLSHRLHSNDGRRHLTRQYIKTMGVWGGRVSPWVTLERDANQPVSLFVCLLQCEEKSVGNNYRLMKVSQGWIRVHVLCKCFLLRWGRMESQWCFGVKSI